MNDNLLKIKRRFLHELNSIMISLFYPILMHLRPTKTNNIIKTRLIKFFGGSVGKNLWMTQNVWIDEMQYIEIGDDVVLSRDLVITTKGGVKIGNRVLIGYGAKILSKNHIIPKELNEPIRFSGHEEKEIIIEDDVWIGANCVILPGVKLGKGCVVAAGAVVTKNIESYTIVGGVPAKLIKRR